jgi:hypothetical protein
MGFPETPQSAEKDALVAVIKAERERHRDLSGEQMVFNVRCTCGHIGQQVSVRGEFERHVDEAVAHAVLARLSTLPERTSG